MVVFGPLALSISWLDEWVLIASGDLLRFGWIWGAWEVMSETERAFSLGVWFGKADSSYHLGLAVFRCVDAAAIEVEGMRSWDILGATLSSTRLLLVVDSHSFKGPSIPARRRLPSLSR